MSRALVTACNLKFAVGARGMLRSARHFHPDITRYCVAPRSDLDSVLDAMGDLATVVTAPRPVAGVPDELLTQLLAARVFVTTLPGRVVAWVDCDVACTVPADALWDVEAGRVNVVRDAVYDLGRVVPRHLAGVRRPLRGRPDRPRLRRRGLRLAEGGLARLPERYERAVGAP